MEQNSVIVLINYFVMYCSLVVRESCTENSIRLFNGTSPYSGTVQICRQSVWGTINSNSWTVNVSRVACRQLGLPTDCKCVARVIGPVNTNNQLFYMTHY